MRLRRLDRAGVSEVLGTILVLLITVIIFSSIILWVFTLPPPREGGNILFEGSLSGNYVGGIWSGAEVRLNHVGGENLHPGSTRIYLTIDNTTEVLKTRGKFFDLLGCLCNITYGVDGSDTTWNIGETWGYLNESIREDAQVSVMVVDLDRGIILWQKPLLGVGEARAPIFVDKWADAAPTTPTRDPVKPGDKFTIFAKVIDPDGDLNVESVWAYLTFRSEYIQLLDDGNLPVSGDQVADDGIYTRSLSFKAQKSWDGGIIILSATDDGGRKTETRLILKVVDTGTSSQVQGPGTLGFGSDVQRYDIFEIGDWDANGWEATSTRSFIKEQGVVVVVASKRIPNPDLKNTFLLWNSSREVVYSNYPYTNPVTGSSVPSTTQAFELTEFISGFYIYEYRFSTTSAAHGFNGTQLQLGYHPLEFELITSQTPSPENRLYVTDYIRVTDISGGSPDYPRVETYRDPGHTISATSFNFTDTMYVKVVVKSVDGNKEFGNVIVSDFFGNVPIWASEGVTPVSVVLEDPDGVSYTFSVDLSQPNLDPWNFGTVSYNLAIMSVQDDDEDYGRVWGQIKVTGPRWKLDIAIGLMSTSQQNFDLAIYGDFFDNVEGWTEYPYETFLASPGKKAPVNPITAQVLGDLDGDGDLDILAGTQMGNVWWYRNRDGKAHSMSRFDIDTLTEVTGVAVGHVDGDPDLDAAVGTITGDLWWYRNDGSWSPNFVDNAGASVSALQLADVNGDGAADLIVGLDVEPDSVRVYLNNGEGVFGTVTTTDTLMASDVPSPGHGTVDGNFLLTAASDDLHQDLKEVRSDGFVAAWEWNASAETVQGSFLDTYAPDGEVQILTEAETGPLPQYTLGFPGHRYLFPNITAAASDTLEVHLVGHISSGSEPFEVGWSKDGFTVTWVSGWVTGRTSGEYLWSISGADWSDETLFVHLMDVDDSRRDQDTDNQLTSLSVDQLYVLQPGSGSISSLAKVWRSVALPSGEDAYKFFVEAHHTLNAENDHLLLQIAAAPHGPYYGLVVVTKTVDDDGTQSVSLPADVGGLSLYILAQDTDRRFGARVNDTFSVDHLFFRSYDATPEFLPISVGDSVLGLTVADIDGDGHQDIVVATTGTRVHVYYGDGTGWPDRDILPHATSNLRTVDVGFVSADLAYDIVVGTSDADILLYTNGGSRGSWILTEIASLSSTTVTSTLRVGDVDGDNWDDVVFGTEDGLVIYLRNDQGMGWSTTGIIQMNDRIDVVDIGDADRGVIIRPHPY